MDGEILYRKLSRKGIVIKNVRYNSLELSELFRRNKKINCLTMEAKINFNSDDVSFIFVYDEIMNNYLKVNNIEGIPENYSFSELELRNKNLNTSKKVMNENHDEKLNDTHKSINAIINTSKYDQKELRRKKVSSDNTYIKPPRLTNTIDFYQESIYTDGGLFDDEDQ